jgi:hypothetical protein
VENKKKLNAEIDNCSPPEVDISNTSVLNKRTILLKVTPTIFIAFQTLSHKCSFFFFFFRQVLRTITGS